MPELHHLADSRTGGFPHHVSDGGRIPAWAYATPNC